MNDNKSRDIFYGVVAIATLIVALIGATLAYFSITANSAEGAVSAKAAMVSIIYEDGQARIAPAENLIPVTFEKLQVLYRRNLADIDSDYANAPEEEETRKNRCKDGKAGSNYEVCSAFRFTVSNDVETNIRAMLRTEYNGFKYLTYAVRDGSCTADADHEDSCWLNLGFDDNDNPVKFLSLASCNNGGDVKCYTEESTTRTYSAIATRPVFGYTSPSDSTFKDIRIAAAEHSYDVVLFINDDDTNQNDDQGQTYSGNIFIETTNSNEKITGQLS